MAARAHGVRVGRRSSLQRRKAGEGVILARINGEEHSIDAGSFTGTGYRPLMVTNIPGKPAKALVWLSHRTADGEGTFNSVIGLLYNMRSRTLRPYPYPLDAEMLAEMSHSKNINVNHLRLGERYRHVGLGTAAMAHVYGEARRLAKKGLKEIRAPMGTGHPKKFYGIFGLTEERPFDRPYKNGRYTGERAGKIGDIKAELRRQRATSERGETEWERALREKGFKIYWAKARHFSEKKQ